MSSTCAKSSARTSIQMDLTIRKYPTIKFENSHDMDNFGAHNSVNILDKWPLLIYHGMQLQEATNNGYRCYLQIGNNYIDIHFYNQ